MTKFPLWILLVTAIAVIGAVLINDQLLEQQLRFEALQSELNRTSARALEFDSTPSASVLTAKMRSENVLTFWTNLMALIAQ